MLCSADRAILANRRHGNHHGAFHYSPSSSAALGYNFQFPDNHYHGNGRMRTASQYHRRILQPSIKFWICQCSFYEGPDRSSDQSRVQENHLVSRISSAIIQVPGSVARKWTVRYSTPVMSISNSTEVVSLSTLGVAARKSSPS